MHEGESDGQGKGVPSEGLPGPHLIGRTERGERVGKKHALTLTMIIIDMMMPLYRAFSEISNLPNRNNTTEPGPPDISQEF